MKVFGIVFLVTVVAGAGFGQAEAVVQRADGGEMVVRVADQPGAPMQISLSAPNGARPNSVTITPQALTEKPIFGYVVVQLNSTRFGFLANTSAGEPLIKGQPGRPYGMSLVSDKQAVIAIDYVLFADGSSWGPNVCKRGKSIYAFVQGWSSAM